LEGTKLVSHQVWVLRSEDDEAFLAELGCEIVIGSVVTLDHVFWASFQAMLAYNHGTPLAGLNVFRHEEDTIGKELGVCVENDFVPRPFCLIVYFSRTRGEREQILFETANDFLLETPTMRNRAFGVGIE